MGYNCRIMLKWLVIFGMLLIVFCAYGHANQIQAKKTDQKPSSPIATIPNQQDNGASLNGEKQNDIQADVKIVNPPQKDFYDKAPVWINIVLVVVALGTGIVISLQSLETRNAAQAALKSVRLQEAQYKQWVEIGGWRNLTSDPIPEDTTLTLGFEVRNTTNFPLTLKHLTTRMGATSSGSSKDHLIAPGNAYAAFYTFEALPAQVEFYRLNQLNVRLVIEVVIKDVLERECAPQRFTPIVTFGPDKCEAVEHTPHFQMRIKQIK